MQHERALDRVLELAHVPRPVVARETERCVGPEPRHRPSGVLGALLEEVLRQPEHVVFALAERRQVHGDDVEPIEEILTEQAGRDGRPEVRVRCRDDAHVDVLDRVASDRFHLAGLERPEQLHLRARRQIADLVQEERAAVGRLEETCACGECRREGTAGVPEELALDQLLRDRCAVDRDERLACASRSLMDLARHELLTRAALAEHEDRRVRLRDAGDDAIDLPHLRTGTDHLARTQIG